MSEIAAATLPLLASGPAFGPVVEGICREIERALEGQIGWQQFLAAGASERCERLTELFYRRPALASRLARHVPGGCRPALIEELVTALRSTREWSALDLYKEFDDDTLRQLLLLSPERVLMMAETLGVALPPVTMRRLLWASAAMAKAAESARLRYLLARLGRVRDRLRKLQLAMDSCAEPGDEPMREAIAKELRETERSMRRVIRLLSGGSVQGKPAPRLGRSAFRMSCKPRAAA